MTKGCTKPEWPTLQKKNVMNVWNKDLPKNIQPDDGLSECARLKENVSEQSTIEPNFGVLRRGRNLAVSVSEKGEVVVRPIQVFVQKFVDHLDLPILN